MLALGEARLVPTINEIICAGLEPRSRCGLRLRQVERHNQPCFAAHA